MVFKQRFRSVCDCFTHFVRLRAANVREKRMQSIVLQLFVWLLMGGVLSTVIRFVYSEWVAAVTSLLHCVILFAFILHIWMCGQITTWVAEYGITFVTLSTVVQDISTSGRYDTWLLLYLMVDALILLGARRRFTWFACGVSGVYFLLQASEQALEWGLYSGLSHEESWTQNVDDKWYPAVAAAGTRLVMLFLNYRVVSRVASHGTRLLDLLGVFSEKLSEVDVAGAENVIAQSDLSARESVKMVTLIMRVQEWVPFLPDSLTYAEADGDGEVDSVASAYLCVLKLRMTQNRALASRDVAKTIKDVSEQYGGQLLQTSDTSLATVVFGLKSHGKPVGEWRKGALSLRIEIASDGNGAVFVAHLADDESDVKLKLYPCDRTDVPELLQGADFKGTTPDGDTLHVEQPILRNGTPVMATMRVLWCQWAEKPIVLEKAPAVVAAASNAALSVRDALKNSSVTVNAGIALEECKVRRTRRSSSAGGDPIVQAAGDGIRVADETSLIAKQLSFTADRGIILCSESAWLWIRNCYETKEAHAGPASSGPLYSCDDLNDVERLRREERLAVASFPKETFVPLEKLECLSQWKEVGKGKTGRVFRAMYCERSEFVAVKEFRRQTWDTSAKEPPTSPTKPALQATLFAAGDPYETGRESKDLSPGSLTRSDTQYQTLPSESHHREIYASSWSSATLPRPPSGSFGTRSQNKSPYSNLRSGTGRKHLALNIEFLKEVRTTSELRHNHIVNFYGYTKTWDGAYYLILEYCRGNLQQIAYTRQTPKWRGETTYDMALSVSQALAYIHSRQKVHMDMASRNVLVTMKQEYKIGDLGFLRSAGERRVVICPRWAPPETLMSTPEQREATYSYDVWSFGMLCYEVLAGHAPFYRVEEAEVKTHICKYHHPPLPESCKHDALCRRLWSEVVLRCLSPNPVGRPSMSDLSRVLSQFHADSGNVLGNSVKDEYKGFNNLDLTLTLTVSNNSERELDTYYDSNCTYGDCQLAS
ncbi:Serine/threonine-protein kinase HT1 [Diplonema papillatum]|nr:Serine/threonine-protein kinase HT1 [Diplonema papillatum]